MKWGLLLLACSCGGAPFTEAPSEGTDARTQLAPDPPPNPSLSEGSSVVPEASAPPIQEDAGAPVHDAAMPVQGPPDVAIKPPVPEASAPCVESQSCAIGVDGGICYCILAGQYSDGRTIESSGSPLPGVCITMRIETGYPCQ